jgi:hypothetical protein
MRMLTTRLTNSERCVNTKSQIIGPPAVHPPRDFGVLIVLAEPFGALEQGQDALGAGVDGVDARLRVLEPQERVREGGRLYVYVDTSTSGLDSSTDESKDKSKAELMERYIARLERQLEEADERDRENRRTIAMLTARIPAIEAPSVAEDAPGSPESPVPTRHPTTGRGAQRGR